MKTSDSIAALAVALSKAQAEIPALEKSATNPFLKNKYIPLDDILTVSLPILAKHDLAIIQLPFSDGGVVIGVTTRIAHKSGEWVEDVISLQQNDEKGKSAAQVAGSIITYLRRYSLASLLGIASETDTDGNGKQTAQPAAKTPAKKAQADTKTPATWKPAAIAWMIDEKLATNGHNAAAVWELLDGDNCPDKGTFAKRAKLYREWREEGGLDPKPAAVFAIEGKTPEGEPSDE